MELTKAVIFFVGIVVAVCSALPASIKDDVEPITPVKSYGDQPIVDTGIFSGWDNPFSSNPFGGLFDNLEGIMERMRQQIASLLNRFPLTKGSNSTEDISPFPGGFDQAGFPAIAGIDLSKGNSSSITKVIDGHTVVINETEYKNEDDYGGTFFKVRIIDVKPDSSELTTEKEAESVPENATSKDREDIGNSAENEIIKSKEAEVIQSSLYDNTQKPDNAQFQNIETFDEVASLENIDNTPTTSINQNAIGSTENRFSTDNEWSNEVNLDGVNSEWSYISPVKSLESNDVESFENEKEYERQIPIDLSRDTYVNELLAQNGASINPDAEVFVVDDIKKLNPFGKIINPR